MAEYTLSNNNKKVSLSYDLKKLDAIEPIVFTNDIVNQVRYTEKGNDIVVYGYGTQQVTYQKVVTEYSAEPETVGINKGKYSCTVKTYKATYDGNGAVTGYEEEPVSKTTYIKNKGEDTTVYQTLNSKNKVIATTNTSVVGENKTIYDEKNALVTLTFKNGLNSGKAIVLHTQSNEGSENLMNEVFTAVKSGKNYKGSWLKEYAESTSDNETFALGTNQDTINYDLSKNHGKDTVTLVKDADLTLTFDNASGIQKVYSKKGNDIIMDMQSSNYSGAEYVKLVKTVTPSSPGWIQHTDKYYVWNGTDYVYDSSRDSMWDQKLAEFNEVQKSLGVKMQIGENVFFIKNQGTANETWYEANSSIGTVTFKNYMKLEEDSVVIGNQSLKTILEAANGIGVLDYHDASKKQTIKGTFLNETITGSQLADTVTTGKGNDTINLTGGKDTVTIDGDGTKTFKFYNDQANFGGETTVKIAKKVNATLDLSATAGVQTMGYVKSGNDLILDYSASSRAQNRVFPDPLNPADESNASKVIIKDYFKDANIANNIIINEGMTLAALQEHYKEDPYDDDYEGEYDLMQIGAENRANTMSDTQYEDYLLGGNKADKFKITHGNAAIISGLGNDTISVSSDVQGILSLTQVKGSGDDVLDLNPGNIKEKHYGVLVDGEYADDDGSTLSFEKTGDDLIVKSAYSDGTKDSLTIKNYFDYFNEDVAEFTYFTFGRNDQQELLYKTLAGFNEDPDKLIKINGFKYGNGTMYEGSKLNDKYEINITNKTNLYIDDGAGQDEVVITSNIQDLRLFVDVYKYDDEYILDDGYFNLYDKNSVKDTILKKDIMKETITGGASFGSHIQDSGEYIFKDKDGNNINMAGWINYVKGQVASWLEGNGYEDVYDVFEGKDKGDIASLVAVYQNITYENTLG